MYQPPLPADQVKPSNEFEYEGEGSPTARAGVVVEGDGEEEGLELHKYEDVGWDVPGGFPRGIVRGRDRSFCGRGRENYNNAPFMDNQQEVGGYNQESPWGRGGYNFRGQGWGGYNNDSCVDNQQEAGGYNQDHMQGVVDAIVVVVADGYADKQVAVVQAVREISVLVGEFLPSRACMTLASLKTTEVSIYIGRVADIAVEHLVTGEMMQMSTSAHSRAVGTFTSIFKYPVLITVSNNAGGRIWLCHSPVFGWSNLRICEDRLVIRFIKLSMFSLPERLKADNTIRVNQ
ncbi:DNA/RNA-binding protein Alba-like protein [Tanacetum coccineum]